MYWTHSSFYRWRTVIHVSKDGNNYEYFRLNSIDNAFKVFEKYYICLGI